MNVANGVLFATLYLIGALLAANLFHSASVVGRYLIGRRRMDWTFSEHRRERLTRLVAACVCGAVASSILTGFMPDAAGSLQAAVTVVGLVVPGLLWLLTRNVHGPEIPDDEPAQKLF